MTILDNIITILKDAIEKIKAWIEAFKALTGSTESSAEGSEVTE